MSIEAASGQDAVDICEGFPPGAIELLLTDVVMPEMNGAEVAQRVSEMHPGVAVLYMSGYTADAILRDGVVHAASDLLQKPFTPDALAAKVREVLDGAQTATGDV